MPFLWEQADRLGAEEVDCFANLTTVSLVGCGLAGNQELAGSFLRAAGNETAVVEQHDGIRLSFAVEKDRLGRILEILHKKMTEKN